MHHRIAAVLLSLLLLPTPMFAVQDKPEDIILAEGTPINVSTTQETTSKSAKPNDAVNFTVDEDVVINGQVVVRRYSGHRERNQCDEGWLPGQVR